MGVPSPAALDVERIVEDFAALYETLHGEGSGHPEGGIEITGLIVRALGLTEAPVLATAAAIGEPEWSSRPVYWQELGAFEETPVLRLREGRVEGQLEGPMLIELPDTVVVLRPEQRAEFTDLGSLVIDV